MVYQFAHRVLSFEQTGGEPSAPQSNPISPHLFIFARMNQLRESLDQLLLIQPLE